MLHQKKNIRNDEVPLEIKKTPIYGKKVLKIRRVVR